MNGQISDTRSKSDRQVTGLDSLHKKDSTALTPDQTRPDTEVKARGKMWDVGCPALRASCVLRPLLSALHVQAVDLEVLHSHFANEPEPGPSLNRY